MAQTLYLPSPHLQTFTPNSPDPTPLRMLAFSVAEAALEADPNSPNVAQAKKQNRWSGSDWSAPWKKSNLWDVVEKAKDRRQGDPPSPPPISPSSYNFVLPPNSPLAVSIATSHRPPSLTIKRVPLETHSAEPSPTRSTFSTLDQTRPPPEFVPRLSAEEFSVKSKQLSSTKHARTKSDVESTPTRLQREKPKLPSLKQIQAKMKKQAGGHVPQPRVARTNSDDSVEVLKTPTDERPSLAILSRRPSTPPSPKAGSFEEKAGLAPFLRQRTNGRLAQTTPGSTPPPNRPALKVTPPSFEARRAVPPLHLMSPTRRTFAAPVVTTPTEGRFNLSTRLSPRTPSSPSGSACTGSPTLQMPIITCTPAPEKVVRNGVEQESDEENDEVVVFDGEAEGAKEREERERRGEEMKNRLKLRKGSD